MAPEHPTTEEQASPVTELSSHQHLQYPGTFAPVSPDSVPTTDTALEYTRSGQAIEPARDSAPGPP